MVGSQVGSGPRHQHGRNILRRHRVRCRTQCSGLLYGCANFVQRRVVALIPMEFERRLASPAAAAAMYRALGEKRVSVRGLHTSDRVRIERVVAAIVPKRDHTISFAGGTLDSATL